MGTGLPRHPFGVIPRSRFADDDHIRLELQRKPESVTHDLVIVDDYDADLRHVCPAGIRIVARTRKPVGALPLTWRRPPTASIRATI